MTSAIMNLETRAATHADEPYLRALFESSRSLGVQALAALPGLLDLQYDAQRRAHAAYPSTLDEIVVVDGSLAGRLLTSRTVDSCHVVDVAISPEHRGRGIATSLLDRLLASGPVSLRVAIDNPARRLYARLGFTEGSATATDLSLHHPGHHLCQGVGA